MPLLAHRDVTSAFPKRLMHYKQNTNSITNSTTEYTYSTVVYQPGYTFSALMMHTQLIVAAPAGFRPPTRGGTLSFPCVEKYHFFCCKDNNNAKSS